MPPELLKPLIADQHGGQIVLMPGGATIDLDPALSAQGVIFTDLKTAARETSRYCSARYSARR